VNWLDAAALQADRPLPDALSLCGEVIYHTLYTDKGVPDGAIRLTDPTAVNSYQVMVRDLYARGEDLDSYFQRAVRPLPPPRPAG
jgi:hypothetical protein